MGGGAFGALPEGAGGAFEDADVQVLQVGADAVPGVAGGGLDDPDQQQGEPATSAPPAPSATDHNGRVPVDNRAGQRSSGCHRGREQLPGQLGVLRLALQP
ncbi:hypothetical protein ACFPFQ_20500 [Pseudonocardia sp. GCM10023141]